MLHELYNEEEAFEEALREFFDYQGAAVLDAIEESADHWPTAQIATAPFVQQTLQNTAFALTELLVERLPAFYIIGWQQAAEDLDFDLEVGGRARSDSVNRAASATQGIQKTTAAALTAAINTAVEDAGVSPLEDKGKQRLLLLLIAIAVREVFQRWKGRRADLIATAESQAAIGRGGDSLARVAAMTESLQKKWQDRGDLNVCPNCRRNTAAGWIPFGNVFPSGAETRPQHPLCRCSVSYRREQ